MTTTETEPIRRAVCVTCARSIRWCERAHVWCDDFDGNDTDEAFPLVYCAGIEDDENPELAYVHHAPQVGTLRFVYPPPTPTDRLAGPAGPDQLGR